MSKPLPDKCPFCCADVTVLDDGKPCRADDGAWVQFDCLTSMHTGQPSRRFQSRPCEAAECGQLGAQVAALQGENAALREHIERLEAVVYDPAALWANWLRGTVQLPAGIGDVRQAEEKAARLESLNKDLVSALGQIVERVTEAHHFWMIDGSDLDAAREVLAKAKGLE